MFRITIDEIRPAGNGEESALADIQIERFRQTFDQLDIARIIAAINTKPRQRRAAKKPSAERSAP
jgi:hypothetical protein